MSDQELTKIEKEIHQKIAPIARTPKNAKNFRVNLAEVKRLAKKIEEYEQIKDAPPIR